MSAYFYTDDPHMMQAVKNLFRCSCNRPIRVAKDTEGRSMLFTISDGKAE